MTSELVISYDRDKRVAILAFNGDSSVWAAVRRVCQDASNETRLIGAASVALPWWALLGCRPQLDYQARRHGFGIRADSSAVGRIVNADRSSKRYENVVKAEIPSADEISAQLTSREFSRVLTAEQLRNVIRLSRFPSGATFSVPGAGKTTEALAFYCLKRHEHSRLLVVCPKNAFPAWEEQLSLCLPQDKPFVRLRGGNASIKKELSKGPEKVLITYQQLPTVGELISEYLEEVTSFAFLDESHRIKRGFKGVIGNEILAFADLPDAKLIMSGTPMPNDIEDLIPQFRFLYPEVAANDTDVKDYIKPIYVRTTKKELKLPDIKYKIVRLPLRPAQFELYELLRSEAARDAAKKRLTLRDRMRLRKTGQSALRMLQIVSNPALLARMQFDHEDLLSEVLSEGDSPKLEYACLRARQLAFEGKKTIIWSSFVDNVELVARRLVDLGADFIHGGVDAGSEDEEGTREQKVKRFHDPDGGCFVLVANPAACGEGISLHTVCHHAIYLDRNYNAAQYLQSQDRIHRLGLLPDQITIVELLVAPGTVDESVDRRISAKIESMYQVLEDDSLQVEPEVVDLDSDGFNTEDMEDFVAHVSKMDRA